MRAEEESLKFNYHRYTAVVVVFGKTPSDETIAIHIFHSPLLFLYFLDTFNLFLRGPLLHYPLLHHSQEARPSMVRLHRAGSE